jgi:hypothetical protein
VETSASFEARSAPPPYPARPRWAMVDLNAHEAGNGGQKPREAYSLPSLLYSEINKTDDTTSFQLLLSPLILQKFYSH